LGKEEGSDRVLGELPKLRATLAYAMEEEELSGLLHELSIHLENAMDNLELLDIRG